MSQGLDNHMTEKKEKTLLKCDTGVPGLLIMEYFPELRIKTFDDCFLCTCVKG